MNAILDAVRVAKEEGNFGLLAQAIPYCRFLGISLEDHTGELLCKMSFAEHLIGNPVLPALHGGTIGALLESTAVFQILWEAQTEAMPKVINVTVDYLRTGRPVDTYAKGTITKPGRRVVNVGVEAWQGDRSRPIARANAHFLIRPVEPK